jgi:CRP-like cAMP-binding protein
MNGNVTTDDVLHSHGYGSRTPAIAGLRGIKLLEQVPEKELGDIARCCAWRRYAREQTILARDGSDKDVYFIASGIVRVTAFSGAGRQLTFRDLGAGEWFGDLAAIDGGRRSADVVALSETLLASVPPTLFLEMVARHPTMTAALVRHLVGHVRDLSMRLFSLSTLGVQNRVHAELLRLARLTQTHDNTASLDPAPRHIDIANHMSTSREEVTRELSRLGRDGIVRRDGRALVICDLKRLQCMVDDVRGRG